MEFRRYVDVMRSHWGIVVLAFSITAGLSTVLVAQQPWVYESDGTYVVRPRTAQADEIVRAFDTLNRGVEINATFAAIAESDLVQDRARTVVGTSPSGLRIAADVIAGTNMIDISVRGTDPDLAHAFAVAVGEETQRYVSELEDAFVLAQLDTPQVPTRPVGPNKALTIGVGVVFGLLLGAALAVVAEYIGEATGRSATFNVLDPPTGAFNADYFGMRLREELARAERTGRGFSVGEIRIHTRDEPPQAAPAKSLRVFIDRIAAATRVEDVIGLTEPGVLSVIFPDLPADACDRLLEDWKLLLEVGSESTHLNVKTSVRTYGFADSDSSEEAAQPRAWV